MSIKGVFEEAADDKIAYVRSVRMEELDGAVEIPVGVQRVYALHDASGRRIALFDSRETAFTVARRNELAPVSAH